MKSALFITVLALAQAKRFSLADHLPVLQAAIKEFHEFKTQQ